MDTSPKILAGKCFNRVVLSFKLILLEIDSSAYHKVNIKTTKFC